LANPAPETVAYQKNSCESPQNDKAVTSKAVRNKADFRYFLDR
jgi:hypothetical protein